MHSRSDVSRSKEGENHPHQIARRGEHRIDFGSGRIKVRQDIADRLVKEAKGMVTIPKNKIIDPSGSKFNYTLINRMLELSEFKDGNDKEHNKIFQKLSDVIKNPYQYSEGKEERVWDQIAKLATESNPVRERLRWLGNTEGYLLSEYEGNSEAELDTSKGYSHPVSLSEAQLKSQENPPYTLDQAFANALDAFNTHRGISTNQNPLMWSDGSKGAKISVVQTQPFDRGIVASDFARSPVPIQRDTQKHRISDAPFPASHRIRTESGEQSSHADRLRETVAEMRAILHPTGEPSLDQVPQQPMRAQEQLSLISSGYEQYGHSDKLGVISLSDDILRQNINIRTDVIKDLNNLSKTISGNIDNITMESTEQYSKLKDLQEFQKAIITYCNYLENSSRIPLDTYKEYPEGLYQLHKKYINEQFPCNHLWHHDATYDSIKTFFESYRSLLSQDHVSQANIDNIRIRIESTNNAEQSTDPQERTNIVAGLEKLKSLVQNNYVENDYRDNRIYIMRKAVSEINALKKIEEKKLSKDLERSRDRIDAFDRLKNKIPRLEDSILKRADNYPESKRKGAWEDSDIKLAKDVKDDIVKVQWRWEYMDKLVHILGLESQPRSIEDTQAAILKSLQDR